MIKGRIKLFIIAMALAVLAVAGPAIASEGMETTGVTVLAQGSMRWTVDLKALSHDPDIHGYFTIHPSGVTCAHISGSGTALYLGGVSWNIDVWYSNYRKPPVTAGVTFFLLPPVSGITQVQTWAPVTGTTWYVAKTPILADESVQTGATMFPVTGQMEPARYLNIEVRAGVTDIWVGSLAINFGFGAGWSKPRAILVASTTWTMPTGGSGVSEFTATSIRAYPLEAKHFYGELTAGTSAYYTTDGVEPAAGTAHVLYKGSTLSLPDHIAKRLKFKAGADECKMRARMQTRKDEE